VYNIQFMISKTCVQSDDDGQGRNMMQ